MTISSITRKSGPYVGNGSSSVFTFAFKVFASSDLLVVRSNPNGTESTLVVGSEYTVTLNVDQNVAPGGVVTLPAVLATGYSLVLTSALPYLQPIKMTNQGGWFPEVINDALDRLTIFVQQLSGLLERTVKLPITSTLSGLVLLSPQAGRFLRWNLTNNALENADGTGTVPGDFIQSGTGAVARSLQSKLGEVVTTDDFGADKTGASNATTAMLNFFNYCIASGRQGHIVAGNYLIDRGVLNFDTPFVDKVWPQITTDGEQAVRFLANNSANAAFIKITNGTATSGVGRYWLGGGIGGITFDQNGQTKLSGQHGLVLRGIAKSTFGFVQGFNLGGDLVKIEYARFSGDNPDPYAISFVRFDGIIANFCNGYAFNNDNGVGWNGCIIDNFRAIECQAGAYRGYGDGNVVNNISIGSCKGWAFEDTGNSGGAGQRFSAGAVGGCELDDVEKGIQIGRLSYFEFVGVRFNHRFNFSYLNPSGGYWPRVCVDLCPPGTVGGNSVYHGVIELNHRVEAGGTKPAMGVFVRGNNDGNIVNVKIDQRVLDNAGFGFTAADTFTGISTSSEQFVGTLKGSIIWDTTDTIGFMYRGSAASIVKNGQWLNFSSNREVAFPTFVYGPAGPYNFAALPHIAPASGKYRYSIKIALALPIGTLLRIGLGIRRAMIDDVYDQQYYYSNNAGAMHYLFAGDIILNFGDEVFVHASQNSGADIAASAILSYGVDVKFSMDRVRS